MECFLKFKINYIYHFCLVMKVEYIVIKVKQIRLARAFVMKAILSIINHNIFLETH